MAILVVPGFPGGGGSDFCAIPDTAHGLVVLDLGSGSTTGAACAARGFLFGLRGFFFRLDFDFHFDCRRRLTRFQHGVEVEFRLCRQDVNNGLVGSLHGVVESVSSRIRLFFAAAIRHHVEEIVAIQLAVFNRGKEGSHGRRGVFIAIEG